MQNLTNIIKTVDEIKSKGLFNGNNISCALCDDDSSILTLVIHYGTEYYLCEEHLYLLLTLVKADHYFSPVSCTYG